MTNVKELLEQVKNVIVEIKTKFNLTGELEILESYQIEGEEIQDSLEGYQLELDKMYLVHSGNFNEEDYVVSIVCKLDGTPLVINVMDEDLNQLYIHTF